MFGTWPEALRPPLANDNRYRHLHARNGGILAVGVGDLD
jgi:hypothetical protein